MSSIVHYTRCPVCGSSNINPLLMVQDHSVSHETFVVWQCSDCSLRFTQDVPDETSIGEYYKSPDYISHSNTDKGWLNKIYQQVRNYTLQQKANLIIAYTGVQRGKVLDVGSGTGAFLHAMQERGWQATGIEPEAEARKKANELFGLVTSDASLLSSLVDHSFDAITLWHVLEHVHSLHPYIETLKRAMRPQGKLFIAVPNYQSLDASVYRMNWAAYDVPRHLYHFTPNAMKVLLQQHGLSIMEKKPMWFDSFYISLLSSKYRTGRTAWASAVANGIRSNMNALVNTDVCSSVLYIVAKT